MGRRRRAPSRRLDALELRSPGRRRAVRGARDRGAPVERRRAGGVAARLADLGARRGAVRRYGTRRVLRGAGVSFPAGMKERVDKLRATLEEPLLVTAPANVRYLTGFVSSNCSLLVDEEKVL